MTNETPKMTAFEKWQVINSVCQTAILIATVLVALYIGLKQTEISAKQAAISAQQTEISKSLLDLPFTISAEIAYEEPTKRINIHNRGQTNVFLWGTKLGDGPLSMESEPRLITPGGFYYLLAEILEGNTRKANKNGVEIRTPFKVFVTSQNGTKYVIDSLIFSKLDGNIVRIHMQTTSIKQTEW